jgi:ribonuclease P protein component
MRLSRARDFQAVYREKMRRGVGPLLVYARPNELGFARLGLSVSRRVGSAVVRSRIKRHLREAFRLLQHDFPGGYDVVIVVRPHDPAALADYQRTLFSALRSLHLRWVGRPPPEPSDGS